MSSTNALALSMRKNALGQKEYPDMTLLGGSFQGLPVIVSQYVGDQLVLVNAPDIYLADDGGVAVDMSARHHWKCSLSRAATVPRRPRWSWFPCSRQAACHPCGALDQLASSPYCGGGGDHRSELRQCVRR
ncbi:peptidase U35, phage prohead HK97 [Escherichia coli]|nr:peptidase U35, phage prohead HK97 [Escherichia coli]